MDIMAKVNELVELISKNDDLLARFKKDPIQAVKGLLGDLDLDDDLLQQLVKGVQGKLSADKVMDALGGLGSLGGLDGLKKLF